MEEDLELESESHQGDMKHSHPVRKAISIKLKAPKVKKKSSKSGKTKKEKSSSDSKDRTRDILDDREKSPRRTKSSSHHHGPRFARQGKEELFWDQTISLCGQKVTHPQIHTCEKCNYPILVYGRLSPCKHVFCLNCAEGAKSKCPRCEDKFDCIEPAGIDQIFVCTYGGSRHGTSGCRKSYLSERDLLAHMKHRRHQKEHASSSGTTETVKQSELQVPQINTLPFFGSQYLDNHAFLRPSMPTIHPTPSPMDNRLLLTGLQHRDQSFIDPQRLSAPSSFPTMQTSQYQGPPSFHADGVPRQSLPATVAPGMDSMYLTHSSSGQFTLAVNVSRPGATLPPNTVHYERSQPYLQAGMPLSQNPVAMQPTRMDTGMQGGMQLVQNPGALQPTRMDTGLQGGHVDTVPMARPMDTGSWHVGGPPPQHPRPPENWPQQGGNNMVGAYDAPRYPPPFYK